MGDIITIYNLRQNPKIYKKWNGMSIEGKRFMLDGLLGEEITEQAWASRLKQWRKKQRENQKAKTGNS